MTQPTIYEAVMQSSCLNPQDTAILAESISKACKMLQQTMPEITADVERNFLDTYHIGINIKVQKTKVPGVCKVTAGVLYNPRRIKASTTGEVEDPRQQQLIGKV